MTRVGFDRLVERGGVKRALDRPSYDASGILAKVVYYAIMLFVLSTAFGVFGSNPISDYLRAVIAYLPLVFVAIVIVVIAVAITAGARNLIENSLGGLFFARVLANLASGLILAIGVIAALDQLHIAAAVVNAVLYAVLAAPPGIAIPVPSPGPMQSGRTTAATDPRRVPLVRNATRGRGPLGQPGSRLKMGWQASGAVRETQPVRRKMTFDDPNGLGGPPS